MINKVYGNSIKDSFRSFDLSSKNESDIIGCSATNNGYEKKFGCVHKREIYIDKNSNFLKGIDHIMKAKDGFPIRYAFRFHINPELNVIKTMRPRHSQTRTALLGKRIMRASQQPTTNNTNKMLIQNLKFKAQLMQYPRKNPTFSDEGGQNEKK